MQAALLKIVGSDIGVSEVKILISCGGTIQIFMSKFYHTDAA